MTNFDRIKNCKSEYEMSNLICGFMFNNISKMRKIDEGIGYTGLPFLYWLQSDRNIFDEDRQYEESEKAIPDTNDWFDITTFGDNERVFRNIKTGETIRVKPESEVDADCNKYSMPMIRIYEGERNDRARNQTENN